MWCLLRDDPVAEQKGGEHALPEDLGRQVAFTLLEEIQRGGVVDSSHQVLQPDVNIPRILASPELGLAGVCLHARGGGANILAAVSRACLPITKSRQHVRPRVSWAA